MGIPEENTKVNQTTKMSSIIMFILLVLAVLAIAFMVYLKSQNIDLKTINLNELVKNSFLSQSSQNAEKKTSEFKYDPKDRPVFSAYKGFIIKCTKDGIRGLNQSGEEQWVIPVSINNPLVKAAGAYLLVIDLGGKDIYVIDGKAIKWSKKIDTNIINADIGENGYVAVVKEAKGYKGAVTVFNLQGKEFFTRCIAERYVIAASVSPSGKQVLINSMDISGVKATTNLEFIDIYGTPIAGKVPVENTIFPSIWYMNDEATLAVGDSMLMCINKKRNEKWKQEFKDGRVYSSSVCLGKYAVAAVSSEKAGVFGKSTTEVKIFNTEGKQAAAYAIEGEVKNVETYSDVIAVNTGREVYFLNTKGKLIGKYSSKIDIINIHFFSKKEAEIITKSSVVVSTIS